MSKAPAWVGPSAPTNPARSWLGRGVPLALPEWGCVTVFWRKAPHTHWGHVGFFLGYSQHGDILLLGGNQTLNPQVCVGEYPRSRLLGFRWQIGRASCRERV